MFIDNNSRNQRRRKAFFISYLEGAFYALMVGSAETYALVFAIKKGIGESEFGVLSTLPIVFGAFSAWLIPSLTKKKFLKVGILTSIMVQILGLAGFFFATQMDNAYFPLLVALSLYWIGGMASGPLWLDWMSGWLPSSKFRPFLSRRNSFVAVMTLSAYVSASYFLVNENDIKVFGYVFLLALIARIISFCFMATQISAELKPSEEITNIWPSQISKKTWVIVLLAMALCFRFAAGLASPFFTPYMFRELNLSLVDYVWITSIPFIARAVCLAQWSRVGVFFHPLSALKISCLGIALVAFLWSYTRSTGSLVLIEILSGFFWAGFELSVVLSLQATFRSSARQVIGLSVALMNVAALAAAQLGALILEQGASFQQLFRDSGYLRLAVSLALIFIATKFPELRSTRRSYQDFLASTLSIRPSMGNIGRLVPIRKNPDNEA